MSIAAEIASVSYTLATGVGEEMPVTFKVLDSSHLRVYADGELQTLTTDYTWTSDGTDAGTGTVTSVSMLAGEEVYITYEIPATQESEFEDGDPFPPEVVEGEFDKSRLILAAIKERLTEVLRFPPGEAATQLGAAAARASKALWFDSNGDPTVYNAAQLLAVIEAEIPDSVVDRPTVTFADASDRGTTTPDFTGQLGIQLDTLGADPLGSLYVSASTSVGDWDAVDARVTAAAAVGTANAAAVAALQTDEGKLPWDITHSDHGAVDGDQTVDTALAIESALSDYGVAYIPSGDWYFRTECDIPSNSLIYGDGNASHCLWSDNNALVAATAATASVQLFQGDGEVGPASPVLDGITIRDLWIDGNGNNQTNMNAALTGVALAGTNHTVLRCKFTGMRAGDQKEAFVVNLHGSYISSTNYPARNCKVLECEFTDGANQTLTGSTLEFTQILISGYQTTDAADLIAEGCEVSGNHFHNLDTDSNQNRSVHGIAILGAGHVARGNIAWDCSGSSFTMFWLQTVNTEDLLLEGNRCRDIYRGVGLHLTTETFRRLKFRDNNFRCEHNCYNFYFSATGSGTLGSVDIQGDSLWSETVACIFFDFDGGPAKLDGFARVRGCTLDNDNSSYDSAQIIVEMVAADAGSSPGTIPNPDEWIVGSNVKPDGTLGTKRFQVSPWPGSGGTWTANSVWTDLL